MIVGMGIIFAGFIFTFTIAIIYFSKQRIDSAETKLYSILIILSLINSIIEFWLCCNILLNVELYSIFNLFVNRSFLLFIFFWLSFFLAYIILISFNKNEKILQKLKNKYNKKIAKNILLRLSPIIIGVIILLIFLPIDLIDDGTYAYSDGPAVYVLYVVLTICIITCFVCMFVNKKNIKWKKIIPFIAFIVCFGILFVGRQLIPGLLLNSFCLAYPTFLMYHTIENPDIKMIEELTKIREATEETINNKNTFLFNVVNRLKDPIKNTKKFGDILNQEDDLSILKEGIYAMVEEAKKAEIIINQILDISTIDEKNLKTFDIKYNINNLLKELVLKINNNYKNKKVEFRTNISKDLPSSLYGDQIKLKQIISTLINNSIKYTDNGFIELRVTSIIRYDICRLIITVEDSGNGIESSKLGKIFENKNVDTSIVNEELDLTLPIVKKMVDYIGGTIIISSEENKGTIINIIINQKIDSHNNENNLEKIVSDINENEKKKILYINDSKKYIKELTKYFEEYDLIFVEGGQKGLEKLRNNEQFDFIIINQNLEKLSSIDTLQKIRLIENYKLPIFILSDDVKIEEYIKIGATDILKIPFTIDNIKYLKDKYL